MARPKGADRGVRVTFFPLVLGRAATLPIETLLRLAAPEIGEKLEEAFELEAHSDEGGARLLQEARAQLVREALPALRRELAKALTAPFLQETLLLSESSLFETAQRYAADPPGEYAEPWQRQAERDLIGRLVRCCTETTPRGTATGVHLGKLAPGLEDPWRLTERPAHADFASRQSLLTLGIVQEIARKATGPAGAWRRVVARANPTLRREPPEGKLAFWKRVPGPEKEILYRLAPSPLLDAFIESVSPRRLTADALITQVQRQFPQYRAEQLEAYYRKLCDQGLLIGHFEIPFEEADGLGCFVRWLEGLPEEDRPEPLLADLREMQVLLARLDDAATPFQARRSTYLALAKKVSEHGLHSPAPDRFLIVDSVSKWRGLELGGEVLAELETVLRTYARLPSGRGESTRIEEELREYLESRFPGRTEIGVLETYAIAESEQPMWRCQRRRSVRERPGDAGWHALIQRLGERLEAPRGAREAVLSSEDLASDHPTGFHVGFLNVRLSGAGERRLVLNGLYPSLSMGFAYWGRLFAGEGADPVHQALARFWREHVAPFWPGKTCGLHYQPDGRAGVKNAHPTMQDCVVEAQGARSARPPESLMPLSDLNFSLEPEGAVVLRSKGDASAAVFAIYDRAHSLKKNAPMIELMNRVCLARNPPLSFSPEPLLADERGGIPGHLPRIVLGRTVLSPETWAFPAPQFQAWKDLKPEDFFVEFNRWRWKSGMPRFLTVHSCSSDKLGSPRTIDCFSPFATDALQSFLAALDPLSEVWIVELLPRPDDWVLRDAQGRYAQELTVGFVVEPEGADAA